MSATLMEVKSRGNLTMAALTQKSRNVTQIEETDVSEVDRFLEEHGGWNHAQRDKVPG
jgi:hypothetical protein